LQAKKFLKLNLKGNAIASGSPFEKSHGNFEFGIRRDCHLGICAHYPAIAYPLGMSFQNICPGTIVLKLPIISI